MSERVRVLVVDDSRTFATALARALASDPGIEVLGMAHHGTDAVTLARKLAPDVITMDLDMPIMNGMDAARAISAERRVPILMLTAFARSNEQRLVLDALRSGVTGVWNKPVLGGRHRVEGVESIIALIKSLPDRAPARVPLPANGAPALRHAALIAVAASTGGPPAIESIVAALAPASPPIVVAQHLAPSFARTFADWLSTSTRRPVVIVNGSEALRSGTVYIAGEQRHLTVGRGVVRSEPSIANELAPNGDRLFASVADAYGGRAVGVVLTGMGQDGAAGLIRLRASGAHTIAQDRQSSAVYGMPRAAVESGGCLEVLGLDQIVRRLASLRSPEDPSP